MIVKIESKLISYGREIQDLCKERFHGHSKGCSRYGKKPGCPPQPLIDKVFDLNKELYVIYTEFAVGKFAERMKQTHPEWSKHPRQWYNPRRWQEKARKEHREEIGLFLEKHPDLIVKKTPEAHGVNVTGLMKKIGVRLKWRWPPEHNLENKTYLVSLAGHYNRKT